MLGTLWLDTSNGSLPAIRVNDGVQWVNCIVVDASNHRPRFILDADLDTYIEGTGVDGGGRIVSESAQIVGINSSGISVGTATPAVSIDCAGRTDAIQLPAGPDSAAPAPTRGRMRWSTTSNSVKVANGTSWGALSGGGSGVASLGAIPNVTIVNQQSGQALVAFGTANWTNGTIGSAGLSAGAVVSTTIGTAAVTQNAVAPSAIDGARIAANSIALRELDTTHSATSIPNTRALVVVGAKAGVDSKIGYLPVAGLNEYSERGGYAFTSTPVSGHTQSLGTTGVDEITIWISNMGVAAAGYTLIRLGAYFNNSSNWDWESSWSSKEARSTSNIVSMSRNGDAGAIWFGHENTSQKINAKIDVRSTVGGYDVVATAARRTTGEAEIATLVGHIGLPSSQRFLHWIGIAAAEADLSSGSVVGGSWRWQSVNHA